MHATDERSPSARDARGATVVALAAAAVLAAAGATAADIPIATDTPEATVASLHRGLVAARQAHPGKRASTRAIKALEPLIEQTHDLAYIAEFALRKQWPMLSEADRQRFVAAFEQAQRDDLCEPLQERHRRHVQERRAGARSSRVERTCSPSIARARPAGCLARLYARAEGRVVADHQYHRRRRQRSRAQARRVSADPRDRARSTT